MYDASLLHNYLTHKLVVCDISNHLLANNYTLFTYLQSWVFPTQLSASLALPSS